MQISDDVTEFFAEEFAGDPRESNVYFSFD